VVVKIHHIWIGASIIVWLLLVLWSSVGVWALVGLIGTAILYYCAVTGGMIKDPLLEHLRDYKNTDPATPVTPLLLLTMLLCIILAEMIPSLVPPGSFFSSVLSRRVFVLLAIIFGGALAVTAWRPELRLALPGWYKNLLALTTLQEQRHIGRAWDRLPRLLRWRLNRDQHSFDVWTDLVRLSFVYGAQHDPDFPPPQE